MSSGATVSRLIVTLLVVVPPADLAVHVIVLPFVSSETVASSQPVRALIRESSSPVVHFTAAGPV